MLCFRVEIKSSKLLLFGDKLCCPFEECNLLMSLEFLSEDKNPRFGDFSSLNLEKEIELFREEEISSEDCKTPRSE